MLTRAKVALHANDSARRVSHFALAKVLYAIPNSVRRSIFAGKQHYCPVCKANLNKFLVLHRPYHLWCPICWSLQRHRLLWVLLTQIQVFSAQQPQRLLHFAPEACLLRQLSSMPYLDYVSADLADPSAMVKMDITQIQFPDNYFDIILCSHVLEHVPDDHKALSELYRVLKSGGQAIILVPVVGDVTHEDPSVIDPREREKLFGQFDHVRVYGFDFDQRLKRAGFSTSIVSTEDIAGPDEIARMGLRKQEIVFIGRKE